MLTYYIILKEQSDTEGQLVESIYRGDQKKPADVLLARRADPLPALERLVNTPSEWPYWSWTGTELVPSAKLRPEHSVITPRQLRLGLLMMGVSPSAVASVIGTIPDAAQREAALVEWEYASEVRREHRLVGVLGVALGKTSAEIDNLFRSARNL